MTITSQNLRFMLGVKIRQNRHRLRMSLKKLSEATGLSISYLSEIEKGKKYPKPEKILHIGEALGVSFDDLVSVQADAGLNPLTEILSSPVLQEFPFQMYGISRQDMLSLLTGDPEKAGAFIRTLFEIGQDYDMRVEHLLLSALRSYQQMHLNYFPDIETAAESFRGEYGLSVVPGPDDAALQRILEKRFGYQVESRPLESHPVLSDIRSVFIPGSPPRLLLNTCLAPNQRAFLLGREIGFHYLGLKERVPTSSWMGARSFDELLNTFKASYFAGAVLLNRNAVVAGLEELFSRERWDGEAFLGEIRRFGVTAETYLYRVSELLPTAMGIKNLFFARFHHRPDEAEYRLTKFFNMTPLFIPKGITAREHHCRRWLPIRLLDELGTGFTTADRRNPLIRAARGQALDGDLEVFTIALAGPASDDGRELVSGAVSFVMDDAFRDKVAFWNDPDLETTALGLTCERCGLEEGRCEDRAAPPTIFTAEHRRRTRENALATLLAEQAEMGNPDSTI